jgi:hypothetical protein
LVLKWRLWRERSLVEPSAPVRAFVARHARDHHLTDSDAPFVSAHVRWGDKISTRAAATGVGSLGSDGKESVQINASESVGAPRATVLTVTRLVVKRPRS